ncbi:MAG: hypothetical protein H0X24_08900, partial [Ktedonobacterales bacterium]|nr:hypothetical protein [Ktedonobacterales bacterium]
MAAAPSSSPVAGEATAREFPAALHALLPWRARAMGFAERHLVGMRGIVITGAALSAIYLLLTLAFPIWSWWYRVDDNLGTIPSHVSWGRPLVALAGPHGLNIWMTIIAAAIILALFGLQALALYAARTTRDVQATRRLVLGFAIAFVVIQVFMQPITSTDLYGYLARSYLTSQLHQNPTITLATFLQGGYLVPHARPPAPYGPLWLLLCWGVGLIAGENLLLAMLVMKALVAAALLGAIFLVAHLTDKLMPGGRIQSLIFFAWSPLLIFEAAGNGHNDMVMLVCVLASLAALQARRPFWAFPLLALGVLVKYSVGALVPLWIVMIFFVYCWRSPANAKKLTLTWPPTREQFALMRRRIDWRRVAGIFVGGGGLAVLIAVVCYAPFWVGLKTFTGLGQQLGATYFNGSIAGMVYAALEVVAPGSKSALGSAIRLMLYLSYGGYLFWQIRGLWRKGSAATVGVLAQYAGKVIFATLVLVTFWYQPWYIT